MHTIPNISKLYEPKLYYENPNVQAFSKLQGTIKKKKETSLVSQLKNPGSSKKYFKFYNKGRIFVYYDDCPPKPESKPKLVIYIQEIKDLQKSFKGKAEHMKICLADKEFTLKFNSVKELNQWFEVLQFFRDFYKNTPLYRVRNYKETIDVETLLDIMAENETDKWDQLKLRLDFTSFFKDKKLEELFLLFPLGQLSNRILLGQLKKKTKWNKDTVPAVIDDPNMRVSVNSGFSGNISPTTPNGTQKSRVKFFEQMNTFGSKPYIGFLISQRPLNEVDQEQHIRDHKAILRPNCLEGYNFNTIYLFDYNGPGDTRPYHKMIAIKSVNQRN